MSPLLLLESLSSMPMPGVGEVVRGTTRCGLAAGFLAAAAGLCAGTTGATCIGAAECELLVASWTAGRDPLDALFTQLSGSSEQRVLANAADANNEQAAIANSRCSGRIRFTWASNRTLPVRE